MENEIINAALAQGVWAALSMALIFYILKKQEIRDQAQFERENKYQEIISNLSKNFNTLESMKEDIKEIKTLISN